MRDRELVVLGTAGAVPTRERALSGYLLRFDGEQILFDPGEGAQRQLLFAGESAAGVDRVCVTHAHGDHCFGLPGLLTRRGLEGAREPLPVHFPAPAAPVIDALLAAAGDRGVVRLPAEPGVVLQTPGWRLLAAPLDHREPTIGYRLEEPDGVRMLPERLAAAGLEGPAVGRLQRQGAVTVNGRTVTLDQVSEPRRGQAFAFLMDTRPCDGAVALARDADLVVCESTFLSEHADLAAERGHCTAAQAAGIAAEAGAHHLVLSHFSQRYAAHDGRFAQEAGAVFGSVTVARDLDRIALPSRPPRPTVGS